MIWITFALLMAIEIAVHARLINKGKDPTPDNVKGGSNQVVIWRFVYVWINYLVFQGLPWNSWLLFSLYLLGVLFSHLLIFPIALNFFRKPRKPADHLGKGWTDRQLAKVPPIARWFWLAVLAAGMIYGYFNPELLDSNYWM